MSNSIWAFATVGFGATIQNTGNNDLILGFNQPEDDRELIARTLDAVVKSSIPRLHKFRPQELNNLSWGICRLGHYNSDYRELLEGIAREIMKRKHQFAPQVRHFSPLSLSWWIVIVLLLINIFQIPVLAHSLFVFIRLTY